MVTSSMPLLPYFCNHANMYRRRGGGRHAMCFIPRRFTLQQWYAASQSMQEGLDVMDGMEGIQQSMAIAGWVGCMWLVLCDLSDFCDFCVCDELVLWVVSLGTGRVPHPGSARKPQPSLLQVLFANQKLISDSQKVFFERIRQGRTSLGNNLLEGLPKSENIQLCHLPCLPYTEGLQHIGGSWSVRRSRRTRLCVVLCRLLIVLINQETYIQKHFNECSCLSRLFAFWILFESF